MKGKKLVLLFLALLFPAVIFVLLKTFGKNEFDVPAWYTDALPELPAECDGLKITAPYTVPDSILNALSEDRDRILCLHFDFSKNKSVTQLNRIKEKFSKDAVLVKTLDDQKYQVWRKCIFLLKEPFDVVLVDKGGNIRGQYNATDRQDIDRMMTELTILLKKY